MKKRSKIILSLLVLSLAVFIGVNVPIIAYGTWQECDYSPTTYNCFTRTGYESYLFQQIGWNDPFAGCCDNSVKTVTLSSAALFSGELATSSLPASSKLVFALNNPGATTYISSLTLSYTNISAITNWDNST